MSECFLIVIQFYVYELTTDSSFFFSFFLNYFFISILWMVNQVKRIWTQSVQSQTTTTAPGKENFQQDVLTTHHQRFPGELLHINFWN